MSFFGPSLIGYERISYERLTVNDDAGGSGITVATLKTDLGFTVAGAINDPNKTQVLMLIQLETSGEFVRLGDVDTNKKQVPTATLGLVLNHGDVFAVSGMRDIENTRMFRGGSNDVTVDCFFYRK